jgi:hypothetical protein
MKRAEYEKTASNAEIKLLIEKAERFSEVLRDIASLAELYAAVSRDAMIARRSIKEGRTALDRAEFVRRLREVNPRAAEIFELAEVLKFDMGRIHLRFPTDRDKAAFGWHRHTIETVSKELYGQPFKVMIKQSALPY